MQLGTDIVYIPEFERRLGDVPLESVFTTAELSHAKRVESQAGIFAAKEAYMKAIGKKIDWHDVWISYAAEGQPQLQTNDLDNNVLVSISHEGEYAIAVVIIT